MCAPKKISLSGLPRGELEALAEQLLAENAALRQVIAEQRAEVATLKGVKDRPKLRPSGMEKATEPEPDTRDRGRGAGGREPQGQAAQHRGGAGHSGGGPRGLHRAVFRRGVAQGHLVQPLVAQHRSIPELLVTASGLRRVDLYMKPLRYGDKQAPDVATAAQELHRVRLRPRPRASGPPRARTR